MAVEQNFTIISGNSAKLNISIDDSDNPPAKKDLTGLTGAAIRWGLFKDAGKTTPLFTEKTLAAGITITGDPTNGAIQVKLDPADTEPIKAGTYYHECLVTDLATDKATVVYGTVTVQANSLE